MHRWVNESAQARLKLRETVKHGDYSKNIVPKNPTSIYRIISSYSSGMLIGT